MPVRQNETDVLRMVLPEEPRQTAVREVIEEAPIELAYFHFAWHVPELRHPDVPALDVLAVLLGSGRSSRLFQSVRDKKGLVSSVDAWTYSPGNQGLFGMSATAEPDKFLAAREAMLAELEQMKLKPVSNEELNKAVKQFTSATLATRKTMQGQAADPGGSWIAANDLNFFGALFGSREESHARRSSAGRHVLPFSREPNVIRTPAKRRGSGRHHGDRTVERERGAENRIAERLAFAAQRKSSTALCRISCRFQRRRAGGTTGAERTDATYCATTNQRHEIPHG